jgi:hypothetical protein
MPIFRQEIDKVADEKKLSALLMPWELGDYGIFDVALVAVLLTGYTTGRCSFEAGSPYIDTSHVIWLCTSNIGHEWVFRHNSTREHPDKPMSRDEYVDLMALLRPMASEVLGVRVLPFSRSSKFRLTLSLGTSIVAGDYRTAVYTVHPEREDGYCQ